MGLSTSYSMGTHGQAGFTDPRNLVTLPGVPMVRPQTKAGQKMIVRFLPCREAGPNGEALSVNGAPKLTEFWRRDANGNFGPGDFVRKYDCAWSVGRDGEPVSYICYDPASPHTDAGQNPLQLLYRTAQNAIDAGRERPGWAGLLKGGNNRSAALTPPTTRYFLTGIVAQNGAAVTSPFLGMTPGQPLPVIALSQTAFMAWYAVATGRKPNAVDGMSCDELFTQGDSLSLAVARWYEFVFHDAKQQGGASFGATMQPGLMPQGGGDRSRFSCTAYPVPFTAVPELTAEQAHDVISRTRNLSDLLQLKSYEEQAHMLAARFPADLIVRAFENYPTWIPDAVREKARQLDGASQFAFPGYPGAPQTGFVGQPGMPPGAAFGVPPAAPGGFDPSTGYPQLPAGFPQQGFAPPAAPAGFPQQGFAPPAAPAGFGVPPAAPAGFGVPPTAPAGFGVPPAAPAGFPQQSSAPPAAPAGFPQPPAAGFGAPPTAPAGFGVPPAAPAGFVAPPAAPAGFGVPPTAPAGFGVPPAAPAGFGAPPAAGFGAPGPAGFPQQGVPDPAAAGLGTVPPGLGPATVPVNGATFAPPSAGQGAFVPPPAGQGAFVPPPAAGPPGDAQGGTRLNATASAMLAAASAVR